MHRSLPFYRILLALLAVVYLMNPGLAQPLALAQPDAAQPGAAQPGAAQPGAAQPGAPAGCGPAGCGTAGESPEIFAY